MSKPFDAGGKTLLELAPAGWLALLGAPRPPEAVSVISADLSTVTAMADQVVRVNDPEPWLLHVEFQAHWDDTLPQRMLAYNGALLAKHGLPVATVAVLMSPAANARSLSGAIHVAPPLGEPWTFRYSVLRLWQMPVQMFLDGAATLLPLALLADVRKPDVKRAAAAVQDRLRALNDPVLADKLMSIFTTLLPLRYNDMTVQDIVSGLGIRGLEQNPGVKAWIDRGLAEGQAKGLAQGMLEGRVEGRVEEARAIILRLGTARFGKPAKRTFAKLEAITDLAVLETLTDRLINATDWKDLLSAPATK